MTFSEAKCRHCRRPITFSQLHTFEGVCDDAKCRFIQLKAWIEKKKKDDATLWQERRDIAITACVDAEARNADGKTDPKQANPLLRSGSGDRQVFPVPAMQRKLTDLPAERHTAFVDHLTSTVDASYLENENIDLQGVDCDFEGIERQAASPLPILSAACGTCRGACCYNGGTHAFVSTQLIDRVRRLNPEISSQAMIELYQSYLRKLSFEESCVYHLPTGCALPRSLRADICNSFECDDLNLIRIRTNSSPAVLVSLNGVSPVRITEFNPVAD